MLHLKPFFGLCFLDKDQRTLLKYEIMFPSVSQNPCLRGWHFTEGQKSEPSPKRQMNGFPEVRLTHRGVLSPSVIPQRHCETLRRRTTVLRIHTLVCFTVADPNRQVHTDKSSCSSCIILARVA